MSRKLQPLQVVTYRKKIVYKNPENESKNFFETFLGLFLVQILAIVVSMATAGIGTGVVAGLGMSQFAQALTSTVIQTTINFSITTLFDSINNNITSQSLLFNFLFSVTDIGKFGRALKQDKLIKLLNQSKVLSELGINQEIKNFYQMQKFLKFKDVLLKDGTKIPFKAVTESELLQSILLVSNSTMKKELKKISAEQLANFMEIQKILYKINPKLITAPGKIDVGKIDKALKNELGMGYDDFLKLSDLDALGALTKLQATKIGTNTLNNLNMIRMQSQIQSSIFESFKKFSRNMKNTTKKFNPFYWANKFLDDLMKPISEAINKIRDNSMKFFNKLPKIARHTIKKHNLIPCQPKSFLMAYSFEPMTMDGSGFITIYKKPYTWKKAVRISNYKSVRVWTNLIELQQFATAPNQDVFYNENWALGKGFNQAEMKLISLVSPGLAKVINQNVKFAKEIQKVKMILEIGLIGSVAAKLKQKQNQFVNSFTNKWIAKGVSIIPGANIFTSSIIKAIRNKEWNNSWVATDTSRIIKKQVIKKGRYIKNAKYI